MFWGFVSLILNQQVQNKTISEPTKNKGKYQKYLFLSKFDEKILINHNGKLYLSLELDTFNGHILDTHTWANSRLNQKKNRNSSRIGPKKDPENLFQDDLGGCVWF